MAALADGCCLSFVAGALVRLAESYTMTDEQREQGGRVRSFFTDAAAQSVRLLPSAGLQGSEWRRNGAGARARLPEPAGTVVAIGISKRWRVLDWCASVLVSSGQRLGLACLVCVVVRYGVGGLSISSRVLSHIS